MEATEQIQSLRTPLHEWHLEQGATMSALNGWTLPAHYGNHPDEYQAVRNGGAGLIDMSARGRLRVSGSEAVPFLNGLITNDMKTLAENQWMPAIFPNVQGRVVATVRVARLGDEEGPKKVPVFLIDTERATRDRVFKTLERFTFAGDFQVTDLSSTAGQISVQGAKAEALLASVFGESSTAPVANGVAVVELNGTAVYVLRASHTGEDGFDLIVDKAEIAPLCTSLKEAGAVPVGFDAFEILRIEAGIPLFGPDFDENLVVSETNLDDAVSFTKGCYIGQEIIARIKYRGHVAKKITGVSFDGPVKVAAGAALLSEEEKEIGRVTSVTDSPKLERTIALALVKYQYLAAGTKVKIRTGDEEVPGTVTDLPFV